MTIIKRKSLIVALVSSFVITLVLVLTLIGYLAYIELKGEEFNISYREGLKKANAKVYSKHIEMSRLSVKIEGQGALKGKTIIEGIVKNSGPRNITSLLINVKFVDRDGAIIYEESVEPQQPSLGASGLPRISIPYLSTPTKIILKQNETLPFKRILVNCPKEILTALGEGSGSAKGAGRWSGTLLFEVLTIEF